MSTFHRKARLTKGRRGFARVANVRLGLQQFLTLLCSVCALTLAGWSAPVGAQQSDSGAGLGRGTVISPVLTIDSERLFLESAFGRRVAEEIEAQGAELAKENRRIEADLEAEERELTDMRATMSPEDFRELADAFDQKVQQIRQAQTAKGRALNDLLDQEREVFLTAAAPVLERLMRDADAAVILERRSVFVSANAIEITEDAIELLDETLGSGSD
ncbi:OmpH family outer membrane protein [Sulfitobacter sp. JBTF-M27]|jgi:Skp family chaperone for outer membrane proteins|uniref:OmpH family outer membrane protein n=1 Tax=Sulfitobacter sediminilitoris TaxID=2698830 RepID=A0A6P0CAF7_9RHOB|nr:OmpH family outer membrane protein [Sulfitobacter sediminilitoris]NEK22185.1 OmpH family outer membrane protein [Sulfitobacter sediminilitoris]